MCRYSHKRSGITNTLWLSMAVFFVVFCSTPVKRYIRLHLYNQKFTIENTRCDYFSTHDIKDCTIADRPEQVQKITVPFVQHCTNGPDEISFLFYENLSSVYSTFFSPEHYGTEIFPPGQSSAPSSIPRYLRIRHLQV